MAEQKTIPTTTITTSNDTDVVIFTFFNRNFFDCDGETGYTDRPYIKEVGIMDSVGYKNGVPFKEGELLIVAENLPGGVDIWLSNGELIIKGDDANSYSIDNNGNLIYNLCEIVCPPTLYVECGYVDDDYVD